MYKYLYILTSTLTLQRPEAYLERQRAACAYTQHLFPSLNSGHMKSTADNGSLYYLRDGRQILTRNTF